MKEFKHVHYFPVDEYMMGMARNSDLVKRGLSQQTAAAIFAVSYAEGLLDDANEYHWQARAFNDLEAEETAIEYEQLAEMYRNYARKNGAATCWKGVNRNENNRNHTAQVA